ncbi:MAG: EAL domain-containing protein [Lachnospiraceae bacterium]|nr:EAL domain-containing protein [Lachnospiraceae bacterium]
MRTNLMKQSGPILFDDMKRTVLVVDDESINRELLGSILEDSYDILYACDGIEALQMINDYSQSISAVLLDLIMPNMDGWTVIKKLQTDETTKHIPIIVLTSEREAEVESLNIGASDFIPKPYDLPDVILARVKRTIELSEDRTILQSVERDKLTGLLTKEFFLEYVALTNHFYKDKNMDAVALNIDRFHLLNEIYGRNFGDRVLQTIATAIYQYARDNDGTAARGEADTFFLYIEHQEDYKQIIRQLKDELKKLSDSINVHIRIGVYQRDLADNDIEKIFDYAKIACNNIRGNFQESIAFYDSNLQKNAIFSERLVHDIYEGLDNGQFKVFFQPKYDIQCDTPRLRSAEALVRWKHPEFGMVSPGQFIPLFENNGLIQKVDHFVWHDVAANIRRWKDEIGYSIPISVNMSRIDICDANIVNRIKRLLKEFDLKPGDFHLEITESAYSSDTERLMDVIDEFREIGFLIELDDFGAGYSSLNTLATMPIDVIKMDMEFVRNMHKDKKTLRMIELIMDIAEFLSVPVVAEGVEDKSQYEFLKSVGCDIIQGYYFSKPLPLDEFEQLLIDNKKEGGKE